MRLTLGDVARYTGSQTPGRDITVSEWSIDTRTLPGGAVYFAIRGDLHDGHSFLDAAAARGATAAVVDFRDWPVREDMILIRVPDPLTAMQDLARAVRPRILFPLIGITGSAGKTTTKETIADLAAGTLRVWRNQGNLNNHIGLPLSLLRMDESAQAGVLEMGMNHAGEIRFLSGIARPDIGVVTNAGTAHIEHFDSAEGVALAKRELIEELGPAGVAVLNYDDVRVRAFREIHPGQTVTFGTESGSDFLAEAVEFTPSGATFRIRDVPFETSLPGRHGVLNVTAGVAVGSLLGLELEGMAATARTLRAGKMRGERIEHQGVTILNDCYNSNPEAAKAMLDTLADTPGGRKIAVLGEMLELGSWAEQFHREVGAHAAKRGIQTVIGIRGAARHLAEAAQEGGAEAHFFDEPAAAGEALRSIAKPGDVVLCKGSRGTRVEQAVERFMAP